MPKCQVCNKSSCGTVRWPTEEDPYICIDCLRKEFTNLQNKITFLGSGIKPSVEVCEKPTAYVFKNGTYWWYHNEKDPFGNAGPFKSKRAALESVDEGGYIPVFA